MDLFLRSWLAPFLFALAASLDRDNFTNTLLRTQADMHIAHGYFQVQTSILAEEFDAILHLLELTSVPQLAGAVDEFNVIDTATVDTLTALQSHPSCLNDWRLELRRQGRRLSTCTDQQLEETKLIYEIFHFMAYFGELLTNEVPLRALMAYRSWQPLIRPTENDPNRFMKDQLRFDLDLYLFLVYDFLVVIQLDVLSSLETFELLTANCVARVTEELNAQVQAVVERAETGQCTGQI